MQAYINKAETLIEAAPYIRKFSGKTVVIKYGGAAMTDPLLEQMVMDDIALLSVLGVKPVIVHGGGPAINAMLKRLSIEPSFENGLRITDPQTMEITEMVLSGSVNKKIVQMLSDRSIRSVGLSGKDGGLFEAKLHRPDGKDIGSVGEIVACNTEVVTALMQNGFLPVISPVSAGDEGDSLNINADIAAVKVAAALHATKLIFLSDVPGVLREIDNPTSLISTIKIDEVPEMVADSVITGGMIPKITCAAEAVQKGVESVHILDGKSKHALLLEIFTDKGVGTVLW
jgi:acetylglutamate kinase